MFKDTIDRYLQLYSAMTPQKIEQFKQFLNDSFTFNDPFHSQIGKVDYPKILQRMFKQLKEPVLQIRKTVLDETDFSALITWDFTASILGKPFHIQGLSKIIGDAKGLLASQTDYWDVSPLKRIEWAWPLKTAMAWQMVK